MVNLDNGGDTVKCEYSSQSIIITSANDTRHRWIPEKKTTNTFEENHKDLDETEVALLPSEDEVMA